MSNRPKPSVDLDVLAVIAGWILAVVLLAWRTFGGPDAAGQWALLCSAAAASGTVIVGMFRAVKQLGGQLQDRLTEAIDERQDPLAVDVADEVIRRMELKEIEDNVAHLVPRTGETGR